MTGVSLWSKIGFREIQRSGKEDVYANSEEYFMSKHCSVVKP